MGDPGTDRVIVVAPTHAEGEAVTAAIRAKLKEDGRLKGEDRTFERLVPLHFTEAERGTVEALPEDAIAVFQRRSGKAAAGERVALCTAAGREAAARSAAAIGVYRREQAQLAVGDSIRITANGKDLTEKHRLNNGATYTVTGFTDAGNIRLDNGWVISKDFGHLAPGYVATSHAAQGRTVDVALIAMGNQSLPAMNSEQFYVSASRARHRTTIYVEDKEAVRQAIARDDKRLLASDLVPEPRRRGLKERLKRHFSLRLRVAGLTRQRDHGITQQPEREHVYER
ncbi:MAG: hypothetical protein K8U57_37000 [Planctomycetes bacterium]|nr:hypothetical protein [Planctomycetota bacterium]